MSKERRPGAGQRWLSALKVLGPFIVLFVVMGFFAAVMGEEVRERFFSARNANIILSQTVIVAIGSLGMTMIIISAGIDLSVGSVIALSSVFGALMIQKSYPLATVVGATIAVGGLVGLVNGSIVTLFRMTPFIVTLGMMGIGRGLAKWLADSQTVNFDNRHPIARIMAIAQSAPSETGAVSLGLPPPAVWLTVALAILMIGVMRRTVFGRYIFAVGSNEATARLCGIRTRLMKISIYTLAGLFFGLAGLLQLSRLRQGDPSIAIGIELDMIAAVVIGGASLNGGTGSILGSMIGALTMAILRNGSTQSDWPNYMQDIIIGIVIVLAVGMDKLRQRS